MPIVTQGHQVQVMPTYSPLDPSRVTFNPAGFAQGALSSFEIVNQLAQQRDMQMRQAAFQQQQAELAATREGRLGALNANNLASINLAPRRNIADIALADQAAALAPGQTNVGLANQETQLADLALKESLRKFTNETATTNAQTDAAVAPAVGQLKVLETDNALANAPLKNEFSVAELTQKLNSLETDKNMTDKQKLATIRNTLAEAAAHEAAARRSDRDETRKVDPIKELSDLQLEIQRLEGTNVINPNADNEGKPMPIIQYQAQTRGPKDQLLTQDPTKLFSPSTWFDGPQPMVVNPEAERIRAQLQTLYDRRNTLTQQLATPQSSAGPAATPTATAAVNPQSPTDLVAAVKAGKISKEAAKEYATSKGWK